MPTASPKEQLASFMAKYDPAIAALADKAVTKLRKIIPSATILVYDNYNALAVGFCASERPSDMIGSIALYPRWVSLFFAHGNEIRDPERLLKGSGKVVRSVNLNSADDLDKPEIRALLDQAVKLSGLSPTAPRGELIIQSISAKQRPRRPAKRAARASR